MKSSVLFFLIGTIFLSCGVPHNTSATKSIEYLKSSDETWSFKLQDDVEAGLVYATKTEDGDVFEYSIPRSDFYSELNIWPRADILLKSLDDHNKDLEVMERQGAPSAAIQEKKENIEVLRKHLKLQEILSTDKNEYFCYSKNGEDFQNRAFFGESGFSCNQLNSVSSRLYNRSQGIPDFNEKVSGLFVTGLSFLDVREFTSPSRIVRSGGFSRATPNGSEKVSTWGQQDATSVSFCRFSYRPKDLRLKANCALGYGSRRSNTISASLNCDLKGLCLDKSEAPSSLVVQIINSRQMRVTVKTQNFRFENIDFLPHEKVNPSHFFRGKIDPGTGRSSRTIKVPISSMTSDNRSSASSSILNSIPRVCGTPYYVGNLMPGCSYASVEEGYVCKLTVSCFEKIEIIGL